MVHTRFHGRHDPRPLAGVGQPRQRTLDGVFLLRMGDELRLKRVQRVAGGAWILISDNSAYERELIKPEDLGGVEIIGQAWRKVGRVLDVEGA
ncbi:S24 family peptidase [Salinicola halophyticus]|uniref:S24 family peptidase n=1 Tax=Salinicola halophyticus TaxID=1808881 RepID=UPI0024782A83|nr:S24 family peptidase [Salinicola halophyticus]